MQLSQSGLCTEVSDCVTTGAGVNKVIFGSGTKLQVNDSKLNSSHSVLKMSQTKSEQMVFLQ